MVDKSINELEHILHELQADENRVTSYLIANDIAVNKANLLANRDKPAGDIRQTRDHNRI